MTDIKDVQRLEDLISIYLESEFKHAHKDVML